MTEPDPQDVEQIVLCATNEGDLYPMWCRMARNGSHDGAWTSATRAYVYGQLVHKGRYDGSTSALTIIAAAMALREYYLAHVKEGQDTNALQLMGQRK